MSTATSGTSDDEAGTSTSSDGSTSEDEPQRPAIARRWGDEDAHRPLGVANHPAGGIVIAGFRYGTPDERDGFVARIDDDGEPVWARDIRAIGQTILYTVVTTSDRVRALGWTSAGDQGSGPVRGLVASWTLDGEYLGSLLYPDVVFDAATATPDGGFAAAGQAGDETVVMKFGADLALDWTVAVTPTSEPVTSLAATPDGRLIGAGTAEADGGQAFFFVLSPEHTLLAGGTFGGDGHDTLTKALAVDAEHYILAGATHSWGTPADHPYEASDAFYALAGPQGLQVWTIGGPASDDFHDLLEIEPGRFVAVGGVGYVATGGVGDVWMLGLEASATSLAAEPVAVLSTVGAEMGYPGFGVAQPDGTVAMALDEAGPDFSIVMVPPGADMDVSCIDPTIGGFSVSPLGQTAMDGGVTIANRSNIAPLDGGDLLTVGEVVLVERTGCAGAAG